MQSLITKQEQSNMNLLDNMMCGMSTAEKLVYGTNPGKKYGYYDVKNSAAWKSIPELKAECIGFKEIIQSDIEEFKKKYKANFKFPTNLTKDEILNDLKRFKEIAKIKFPTNPEIIRYYSDMINLIQGLKTERYNIREVLYDYPDIKCPDCKRGINYLANIMFKNGRNAECQMKENEKQLMENEGKFKYYAKLNIQPGRLGNKGNDINEYYKKPGEYEEEEEDKYHPNC